MTAVPKFGTLTQREKPYRSEAYRRYVAAQPCMACGYVGCQAAHISAGNFARGMKAPDYYCIPLCLRCHDDFDIRSGRYTNQKSAALGLFGLSIDALKARAKAQWIAWESQQVRRTA